jgi:hypothetical protein
MIRPARYEDAIPVCDLLRDLGLTLPPKSEEQKVMAHWRRMWTDNPYYKTYNEPVFYGWVMEHNKQIVGFFGTVPRVYYMKGQPIPVSIASNWGVMKEYRGHTSMLCDAYFNANPIAMKLVTTAIKPTGKIFERYNGKRVPDASLDSVYIVPFNLPKLMALKFSKDKLSFIAPLIKLMSVIPVWKLPFHFAKDKGLEEADVFNMPADYDAFINGFVKANQSFMASRDVQTLQWVYGRGKRDLLKKVFVYRSADSKIAGYASLIDEPIVGDSSFKRYKIGDLLAADAATKTAMLKALIRYAADMKADVLEIHIPNTIQKEEIPCFTLQRKVPSFPVFYQSSDDSINQYLEEKNNWFLSPYDGDTILG